MSYKCPQCKKPCKVLYSVPGQDIKGKATIELLDLDYMCERCMTSSEAYIELQQKK